MVSSDIEGSSLQSRDGLKQYYKSDSQHRLVSRRVIEENALLLQGSSSKNEIVSVSSLGENNSSDEESFVLSKKFPTQTTQGLNLSAETNLAGENGQATPTLFFSDLLPYYVPMFSWISQYSLEFFMGDLAGGISLAAFQIPLALSYASSLAKVPVTCGLYSLGFAPLIYMIMGSVPQMITGPEAPISLIVGQAVEPLLHHSKKEKMTATEYVVAITFVSGATLLGFGLGRFGFLDNVLCESLLKGFICGVGAVMVISSSIPMLGLEDLLSQVINDKSGPDIHSPFDKLMFVLKHYHKAHALTFKVSITAFFIIIICRHLKRVASYSKGRFLRYAVYFPEILLVVISSTVLCSIFKWNNKGIGIVGSISDVDTNIPFYNPFSKEHLKLMKSLSTSGFTCAMLGFFESTTASKSLGSRYNLPISSNRELVALGMINIVCSFFGGLPSFGGYGRSKMNAMSAKTTLSGAIMGIISLITARFVLGYLHYIPKCILSVVTGVIGISLISEGPPEIKFHWKSKGYDEIITFTITVLTTIFFSMEAGIAVGLVYSLIRVIRNSAESNIQILGRIPGTNTFSNADLPSNSKLAAFNNNSRSQPLENRSSQLNIFTDNLRALNYRALEEIEGCLIIKIPEPLTFANANDLRVRLKRLEMYGSARAHPASKRSRAASMSKYMIFDLEGMTFIDSSAAQLLHQSLMTYYSQGTKSFFVRVNNNQVLLDRLMNTGITDILSSQLDIMINTSTNSSKEVRSQNSAENVWVSTLRNFPYFDHIRDVLKVIDEYELDLTSHQELDT